MKRLNYETQYCVEGGLDGSYRLVRDGELVYEDPACEDLNEDKETAEAFFTQYITDYVDVYHVNHKAYLVRVVEDEKFYHLCYDGLHESHYNKKEWKLEDAIKEELDD